MTKTRIRKEYKNKRAQFSLEEIEEKSLAIANQSLKLPIWEESIYSLYLSIKKFKEVNTEYLLHILQGKDKDVVLSKSDLEGRSMTHYLLTDNTRMQINAWGIPEPIDGIEVSPQQIDVVFVPLLAFDNRGHRIGYGKGYYDYFLAQCRPETLKIGLSFFEAQPKNIEYGEFDIPLDYCITPEKIYRFSEEQ